MVEVDVTEPEDIINVPVEATAFLAAVSALAVLLFVIFVYVNKKWRILNVGLNASKPTGRGTQIPVKQHDNSTKRLSPFRPHLGDSYILTPESSSDSEEDVLRRLRSQMSLQQHHETTLQDHRVSMSRGSPLLTTAVRSFSLDQASSHHHHPHHHHPHLMQHRSFDLTYHPLHQSTPNYSSNTAVPSSAGHNLFHGAGSSAYTSVRPLRIAGGRDMDNVASSSCTSNSSRRRSKGLMASSSMGGVRGGGERGDLMSLAEKGKVNSSSASSTSSNGSTEDDPTRAPHHQHHHHHHHGMRAHPVRVDPSRPVSVSSSTATTLVATPQPHSSHQQPPPPPIHHTHQQQQHAHSQHSAPCSTTGFRRMMPPRTKSIDSESPPPSQGCSTYGDSIADQDDHIFEVEEMSLAEGELGMVVDSGRGGTSSPVQCGSLEVALDYEAAARKMTVHVIQVRGVPPKDMGGANNTQIRLVLLPDRKQKHKTKVRPGEHPSFMETFVFSKVNPEDVSSLGIRFRLYGCERMRRERLLGECILGFGSLHLEMETTTWLNFEPRYHLSWDSKSETASLSRSDSASSTTSIQSGIPELLVGLAYNGTTGRLTVEIIKGSHFRQLAGGKAPDSYVKLVLVSCTGQEMGRSKTSLRRAQSNPLFKETFMFQVALFQVQEVTLLVSVYGRKGVTRRELLGWFALGYNSSGDEETTHWEDMCDAQGDQMCRWHVLQT
ncbi:synaptotagmin-C isoform X2 [Folsomia candida]|uniref:Synaptotagmin-16 n=1 Tax=Folsomia candida TaxID=158441 RepID=A0A226ES15_FOLCA|nr:synaptotagmin-C isoform X2 [Folsomia candida]OXA60425.1 Synaptotagmin-16 [Folsomia candida]